MFDQPKLKIEWDVNEAAYKSSEFNVPNACIVFRARTMGTG